MCYPNLDFISVPRNTVSDFQIHYAVKNLRTGPILIGILIDANMSICFLHFITESFEKTLLAMQERWPNCVYVHNHPLVSLVAERAFGHELIQSTMAVRGNPFQLKIWNGLLNIPLGEMWSLEKFADSVGEINSMEEIAKALAQNDIAILIPCHRILDHDIVQIEYRWGKERKIFLQDHEQQMLLAMEN